MDVRRLLFTFQLSEPGTMSVVQEINQDYRHHRFDSHFKGEEEVKGELKVG